MKGMKTGGRKKGTPNKCTPEKRAIKQLLQKHSLLYMEPGEDGVSDFERDLRQMTPAERAAMEIKVLEFHTPRMQATSIDARLNEASVTIEDRLIKLSQTEDDNNDNHNDNAI